MNKSLFVQIHRWLESDVMEYLLTQYSPILNHNFVQSISPLQRCTNSLLFNSVEESLPYQSVQIKWPQYKLIDLITN